ncbi:MAG: hypothetical protein CMG66_01535 [Candidatus Marinimicrobia bacterium]|nr:hypothetical protein [Candidatus Neomarinimicrobiota bacterium]|tara:strand:- start:47530 stop:47718 length:189 start_codon:yes stop_codon:yes gene_type:complete
MPKPDTNFQKAMSAAYTLLGSILVLSGLGYYLSHKYNNIAWLIIFSILGIIVGMYELYKQIK